MTCYSVLIIVACNNYLRFGSVYWAEMCQLPSSHPWVHEQIQRRGSWTVQRTEVPFSSTSADQTIEQTINRDSKTTGGVKGVTLRPGQLEFNVLYLLEINPIHENTLLTPLIWSCT